MKIQRRLPESVTVPGAVDPHTHLREPSPENKAENFESGSLAALHGGYVFLNDMPNTEDHPTNSCDRVVEKHRLIQRNAFTPIGVVGGVNPESGDVSQIKPMAPQVTGFKFYADITTGNNQQYDAAIFEPIVEEIHKVDPTLPIFLHAGEDNTEDFIHLVADIYNQPLHICHVNKPSDVDLVTKAKINGLQVTCEVTPDHLFLTEEDIKRLRWYGRRKPPLVSIKDSEYLMYKLIHGAIDMIGTDHAPHSITRKLRAELENPDALDDLEKPRPYGTPNIEVSNLLLLRECMLGGLAVDKTFASSMKRFIEITNKAPLRLLGMKMTGVQVIYELEEREMGREDIHSKAGWSQFVGKKIGGKVVEVAMRGKFILRDGQLVNNAKAGVPMWAKGMTI